MNNFQPAADEQSIATPTANEMRRMLLRRMLRTMAVSLLLANLLFLLRGDSSINDLLITIVYALFILVGEWFLRTNNIKWLAHGFTAVFWLSITIFLLLYGSNQIPSPGAYAIFILITLLLLRGRVTVIYSLISLITIVLLIMATLKGQIPLLAMPLTETNTLMKEMSQAFLTFTLLGASYVSLRLTLETLRFNEHALQQIRQTLGKRTEELTETNEQLRREVSEREQAEASLKQQRAFLREKEENFRALVEASFDGIVITVDHIIQEANFSFAMMFGFSAIDDVLGKSIRQFFKLEDSTSLEKNMKQNQKIVLEATGVRQDNSTFPVELVSQTIDFQGQAAHISGIQDITIRKQAEEAEQNAQRLESLSLMAGGLAHDFNNLLVAMMSQIAIAKAKIEPNHLSQNNLDKAIQATETAALLTRQLLAYTGQGHFEITTVHLNQLITQNLHLFEDALPANITFHTKLHNPLPNIQADSVQIQQIIMNLLLNAAEALGTNQGIITIKTMPHQLTDAQLPAWRPHNDSIAAGEYVLLEVSDTGKGIDEATLSRMFDPFFSTKGTGRGLGLAAVMGIVRGHQGSVRATSAVGKGTTFQFLFPSEEAIADEAVATAVSPPPAQQNSVLIIDDERQVREAIGDILDLEEIPTLAAASGAAGIDQYTAHRDEIGLIILDLSMPGMSGIEAFEALRQIDPNVKIILSSGYTEAEILEKMAGTRPTGFLQKPYRLETVLQVAKQHLS
ncbi:hybrid sensor histidine kinase/response regulator [Candidatus Leptofilum sp.]|uniref:hybrid sensor histidine kinase/response regulator n=1 Tax=Candidatus Leptofilum sp. TaxID=3241576 RepID=UPI003B590FDE